MRKFYFIKINLSSGASSLLYKNGFEQASAKATETQQADIDATINATVRSHAPAGVWLRRADARRVAAKANEIVAGGVQYSVVGVGEFKRTVRPVLGYRLLVRHSRGWEVSAYNDTGDVAVDHAAQFGGDTDANKLFSTRAKARAAKFEAEAKINSKYKIDTIYADA